MTGLGPAGIGMGGVDIDTLHGKSSTLLRSRGAIRGRGLSQNTSPLQSPTCIPKDLSAAGIAQSRYSKSNARLQQIIKLQAPNKSCSNFYKKKQSLHSYSKKGREIDDNAMLN
tara:strand:+ start:138 stop:476 length:339 start_codon:yes stop_codon:yes gene_type:complete